MSASTEKKLRQAAREAGTDKKTLALEKEAKEKANTDLIIKSNQGLITRV